MLQGKIDIDTKVPSVTARTTRPLSTTAVKPRTEAGRSSNSFASRAFSTAAPTVWKSLPDNVVNSGHLGNF